MRITNYLCGVTGNVADIPTPNKAIIHFELDGDPQTAFLKNFRFWEDGKRLTDVQNLNKFLKVGHKVKFSCHLNLNSEPGQCKWFIINCWRHDESDNNVVMSSGIMNVIGTVTDLKQRHGALFMSDLLGKEYKVHFLASKVYLFGKRLSKPLSSQLQIDDKVFFDAVPCFPEENNQNCDWFATCVCKGKKPEIQLYKDPSKTAIAQNLLDKEKMLGGVTIDSFIIKGSEVLNLNANTPPIHFPDTIKYNSNINEEKQSLEISGINENEFFREVSNVRIEPKRLNAQMLQDMRLLINDPRGVFVKSKGIILDIINEEYGVILGEFKRNVFQSILFHRSNTFLFKMTLANSKLSEIFIEGDRVQFIAVHAPEKFVCDWIATQVCVACNEQEDEDQLDDDFSEDFSFAE